MFYKKIVILSLASCSLSTIAMNRHLHARSSIYEGPHETHLYTQKENNAQQFLIEVVRKHKNIPADTKLTERILDMSIPINSALQEYRECNSNKESKKDKEMQIDICVALPYEINEQQQRNISQKLLQHLPKTPGTTIPTINFRIYNEQERTLRTIDTSIFDAYEHASQVNYANPLAVASGLFTMGLGMLPHMASQGQRYSYTSEAFDGAQSTMNYNYKVDKPSDTLKKISNIIDDAQDVTTKARGIELLKQLRTKARKSTISTTARLISYATWAGLLSCLLYKSASQKQTPTMALAKVATLYGYSLLENTLLPSPVFKDAPWWQQPLGDMIGKCVDWLYLPWTTQLPFKYYNTYKKAEQILAKQLDKIVKNK